MNVILAVLFGIVGWLCGVAAGLTTTACLILGIIKLLNVAAIPVHVGWLALIGWPAALWVSSLVCLFIAAVVADR